MIIDTGNDTLNDVINNFSNYSELVKEPFFRITTFEDTFEYLEFMIYAYTTEYQGYCGEIPQSAIDSLKDIVNEKLCAHTDEGCSHYECYEIIKRQVDEFIEYDSDGQYKHLEEIIYNYSPECRWQYGDALLEKMKQGKMNQIKNGKYMIIDALITSEKLSNEYKHSFIEEAKYLKKNPKGEPIKRYFERDPQDAALIVWLSKYGRTISTFIMNAVKTKEHYEAGRKIYYTLFQKDNSIGKNYNKDNFTSLDSFEAELTVKDIELADSIMQLIGISIPDPRLKKMEEFVAKNISPADPI